MTQDMVLEKAHLAQALGATVEIVGSWVWASFDQLPPPATRAQLKAASFHWNPKRHLWQLAGRRCGASPAANDVLRKKYAAYSLVADDTQPSSTPFTT